jgi:hypothetical protein
MPVTLESRLRQMQVFNLPHDAYCDEGKCACSDMTVVVVEETSRTGERAPKQVAKKAPASMTLLALERKTGLPTALLDVPDVKAAIARGYVRVIEQLPDAPPAPPPMPSTLHDAVSSALPKEE